MWRYKWMSLTIITLAVALSAVVGFYVAPPPQATASIALKTPREDNVLSPGLQGDASLARYTTQRSKFVTGDAVMDAVASQVEGEDATSIRNSVIATPSANSNVITLEVYGETPEEAVHIAELTVEAFRDETKAHIGTLTQDAIESIQASAAGIAKQLANPQTDDEAAATAASTLAEMQLQVSEIQTSTALLGDGVEFVVAPRLDSVSEPGLPLREAALGLIVGLVVAATAAWKRADAALAKQARRPRPETHDDDKSGSPPSPFDPQPQKPRRSSRNRAETKQPPTTSKQGGAAKGPKGTKQSAFSTPPGGRVALPPLTQYQPRP